MSESTKYVVASLDFDEGLGFYGLYGSREEAFEKTRGIHAHVHCEVLEVEPLVAGLEFDPVAVEDEPHLVVTGTFAEGYKVHGPYPSFEAAESDSGAYPEHVYLAPLLSA